MLGDWNEMQQKNTAHKKMATAHNNLGHSEVTA